MAKKYILLKDGIDTTDDMPISKGAADNNADSHIEDVAFCDEALEIGPECGFCHNNCSFLFILMYLRTESDAVYLTTML